MALADLADGLEITHEQRGRDVPITDDTDASLATRLVPVADRLPTSTEAAATILECYATGASVGSAARSAGVPPIEGAKTLHLLGEPVQPLGPTGRQIVRDWLAAELGRMEAIELAGVSSAEFALAVYIETHEPIDEAVQAAAGALANDDDASVAKRDHLAETMSDVTALR